MIVKRNVVNWLFDCNVVRKMEKFIKCVVKSIFKKLLPNVILSVRLLKCFGLI